MNTNPVAYCTLIIRSQVEYSLTTQTVVMRCMLEKSATGQRHGFTDVDALLTVLRAELMALQTQIIPLDQQNLENPAVIDGAPSVPALPPLLKADRSTDADAH